jgi:hypothetical protein
VTVAKIKPTNFRLPRSAMVIPSVFPLMTLMAGQKFRIR